MPKDECQEEMLPRYKIKSVNLKEIATGVESRTIPHINISGQLKLEEHRFMENFNRDATSSAVQAKEVNMRQHPTLANILMIVGSEDTRLHGNPYTINEEFFRG